MLLLRTEMLPEGPEWGYEIELDGYRALAFKTGGVLSLRSRNDNDFAQRYPSIAEALASLPNDTAVDGEIVALDEAGKPSFNALQNYGSSKADLIYLRLRHHGARWEGRNGRALGPAARSAGEESVAEAG
jgi:ATP-dependent DNA ligase